MRTQVFESSSSARERRESAGFSNWQRTRKTVAGDGVPLHRGCGKGPRERGETGKDGEKILWK